MGILQSEGFDRLVESVAAEAGAEEGAYQAAHYVATIGGRLSPEIGIGALTRGENALLEAMRSSGARLDRAAADRPDVHRVAVTSTGKLRILRNGEVAPPGVTPVGAVESPGGLPADVDGEVERQDRLDRAEESACRTWLLHQGDSRVEQMLDHLRHTLQHVGPMRVYVGNSCYTNLGREGNLVGKSIAADSDRCTLNQLSATPVANWCAADACFVVCMTVLISSGTPSRTEEFSGTQLLPGRLEEFLEDRVLVYDGKVLERRPEQSSVDRIFALAEQARSMRVEKLQRGFVAYRTIQSMTINKREHFFDSLVSGADLPEAFAQIVRDFVPAADSADIAALEVTWSSLFAGGLTPTDEAFTSRFEEAVHHLVEAATHATDSDVGMSRGPRDVARLGRLIAAGSTEPGHWKTNDYYCCVVPSRSFTRRFASVPDELPQVIRAIAARMRWNGWHFMPHASGVADDPSFADRDWFFAPSMPDMTEWTSHHHRGHIANGVRHAIRVPLSLTLAGASRPGIHDLRLMRSEGSVYAERELRAAVAMGEILRGLYQAHASWLEALQQDFTVSDFGNGWYQARYRADSLTTATAGDEDG